MYVDKKLMSFYTYICFNLLYTKFPPIQRCTEICLRTLTQVLLSYRHRQKYLDKSYMVEMIKKCRVKFCSIQRSNYRFRSLPFIMHHGEMLCPNLIVWKCWIEFLDFQNDVIDAVGADIIQCHVNDGPSRLR